MVLIIACKCVVCQLLSMCSKVPLEAYSSTCSSMQMFSKHPLCCGTSELYACAERMAAHLLPCH